MNRRFRTAWTSLLAAFAVTICASGVRAQPDAKEARRNTYEPQALRLLEQMADAYTQLSSLRQETEFRSVIMPLVPLPKDIAPPAGPDAGDDSGPSKADGKSVLNSEHKLDRKIRLSYAAPNRLRLEVEDTDENGKLQVSQWVCDGKSFWTFNPEKNLFSREQAPKRIRDFAKLAHMTSGSLEVLMLMGVNPFVQVREQTEGVHLVGRETVLGVMTDVVAMSADLGLQATETRLYIGADDHLLYRLVSETSQKPQAPRRSGVGSPLDELAPPEHAFDPGPQEPAAAPALLGVLMKTRVTCDNKIDLDPAFGAGAFSYQPPADAFYLTNPDPHKPPMTMKQRIAELNKNARHQKKPRPRVYRY